MPVLKAIFIGPSGSGKRDIIARLLGKESHESLKTQPDFDFFGCPVNNNTRFTYWYFSGKEGSQNKISNSYLQNACFVIYTLDGSNSLQGQIAYLQTRHQAVSALSPDAIFIFVVNKADLNQEISQNDLKDVLSQWNISPDKLKILPKCSAKTGEGLKELKRLLLEKVEANQAPIELRRNTFGRNENHKESGPFGDVYKNIFQEAQGIEFLGTPYDEELQSKFRQFQVQLQKVADQTINDCVVGKITEAEAQIIANAVKVLTVAVAKADSSLPKAISEFRTTVSPCIKTTRLGKLIGGLIGAALGVVVGAMLGVWSGPGAAVTALAGGVKGAVIGASLGGVVFGPVGVSFSMWCEKRKHHLGDLANEAQAISRYMKSKPV